MNTLHRLLQRAAILAALLCGLVSLAPAGTDVDAIQVSPAWHQALEPLRSMPVQDNGFICSTLTFAENYISAISGKRNIGKTEAVDALFFMLRDPKVAVDAPIIKLSHPELVKLFGQPRISSNQWHDEKYRDGLMALVKADQKKWMNPLNSIEYRASLLADVESGFAILPRKDAWLTPGEAAKASNLDSVDQKILAEWKALKAALAADKADEGATAARELSQAVDLAAKGRGVSLAHVDSDLFYHTHRPFYKAAALYLFSSLFFGAGLMLMKPRLHTAGFLLLLAGLVEHGIGVAVRWSLAGRAPLSNMYESFTFAVGGMVLIAVVLEASKTVRLAGLAGSVLGFIFMVIAHNAPIFDSKISPLMPALQSSWLTYHVITIMLSYSAFALSFFVAAIYLLKDWFLGGDSGVGTLGSRLPSLRALDVFTYRIIAVGFPLLTLGIIFGAVWAATAWGRPWGFDPKETWSAITWLVYSIYLHVRYLAGWSGRRAAILSVLGFLAVLFTYLGVNYLLPGLHSYV